MIQKSIGSAFGAAVNFKTLVATIGLISATGTACGQVAQFDGDRLFIPVVLVENTATYSDEMRISSMPGPDGVYPFGSSPVLQMFHTNEVKALTNPVLDNPARYESGILVVPRIEVNGNYFWAHFALWDSDPSHELIAYGEDDEDDDNDGVPDTEDPKPWSSSHSGDPLGIAGDWLLRRELVGDLSSTLCGHFQRVTYHEVEISYDSEIDRYRFRSGETSAVSDPLYPPGLGLDVTYTLGEGYIDTFFDLNVWSSQLLKGTETWNWTGSTGGSCHNNQSIVHAVRQP